MFKKIVGLGFSNTGKNAKDVHNYINDLVKGGANEFFTGYNPSYWHEKFGFEVSPNMRFAEHEQITDFNTLKQITEEVHSHGLEIFANLNFWYYTDETFPYIEKIYEEFISVGVDGIICSSIAVLEYLKSKNFKGKINISTIMAVYNKEAIKFLLHNYKINKIILSRELTLKEIEGILEEFPDTLFEVFGEGDFCRYNNGLCFAEHKYSNKDICTVVVNDLIIKNKFRPDFKKVILDENLSPEEKSDYFDLDFHDVFEMMEDIISIINLGVGDEASLKKELKNLVLISKNRIDLYFDALKSINSKHNNNILTYLKSLKILDLEEFKGLEKELKSSYRSGIQYYTEKAKELGGDFRLKAFEVGSFYGRNDNLNMYSYLFFSKFPNLETVKFPTRGRSHNEKIKNIEKVLEIGGIDIRFFDRGIGLDRIHYDLTYIFGDRLWFRDLLKQFY